MTRLPRRRARCRSSANRDGCRADKFESPRCSVVWRSDAAAKPPRAISSEPGSRSGQSARRASRARARGAHLVGYRHRVVRRQAPRRCSTARRRSLDARRRATIDALAATSFGDAACRRSRRPSSDSAPPPPPSASCTPSRSTMIADRRARARRRAALGTRARRPRGAATPRGRAKIRASSCVRARRDARIDRSARGQLPPARCRSRRCQGAHRPASLQRNVDERAQRFRARGARTGVVDVRCARSLIAEARHCAGAERGEPRRASAFDARAARSRRRAPYAIAFAIKPPDESTWRRRRSARRRCRGAALVLLEAADSCATATKTSRAVCSAGTAGIPSTRWVSVGGAARSDRLGVLAALARSSACRCSRSRRSAAAALVEARRSARIGGAGCARATTAASIACGARARHARLARAWAHRHEVRVVRRQLLGAASSALHLPHVRWQPDAPTLARARGARTVAVRWSRESAQLAARSVRALTARAFHVRARARRRACSSARSARPPRSGFGSAPSANCSPDAPALARACAREAARSGGAAGGVGGETAADERAIWLKSPPMSSPGRARAAERSSLVGEPRLRRRAAAPPAVVAGRRAAASALGDVRRSGRRDAARRKRSFHAVALRSTFVPAASWEAASGQQLVPRRASRISPLPSRGSPARARSTSTRRARCGRGQRSHSRDRRRGPRAVRSSARPRRGAEANARPRRAARERRDRASARACAGELLGRRLARSARPSRRNWAARAPPARARRGRRARRAPHEREVVDGLHAGNRFSGGPPCRTARLRSLRASQRAGAALGRSRHVARPALGVRRVGSSWPRAAPRARARGASVCTGAAGGERSECRKLSSERLRRRD